MFPWGGYTEAVFLYPCYTLCWQLHLVMCESFLVGTGVEGIKESWRAAEVISEAAASAAKEASRFVGH